MPITHIEYGRQQGGFAMPPLRLMKGADGADGFLGFKPSVGRFFTNSPNSTSYTNATTSVADVAHLSPILVQFDCGINQIHMNVATAIAGANGKLGLYRSGQDKRTLSLLAECPEISLATIGAKAGILPSPLQLFRGEVLWGIIRHSHTGVLMSAPQLYSCPTIDHGGATFSTINKSVIKTGVTYASAAPVSWVWDDSNLSIAAAPLFGLRIAS